MSKSYYLADIHIDDESMLFMRDNNNCLVRPFNNIEELQEKIITNINERVKIQDKLYLIGDIVIYRKNLNILDRINTKKKILIKGNHDIFQIKDYLKYFRDIRAYKVLSEYGIIFSHIPIHPLGLQGRWKLNCHGHIHHNIINDQRYLNLCCEQTNYLPVELDEILEKIKNGEQNES